MIRCDKTDCLTEARWTPVFLFYAPDCYTGDPIEVLIGLNLCDQHKDTFNKTNFLPNLQVAVENACKQLVKPVPDWTKTKVELRLLADIKKQAAEQN